MTQAPQEPSCLAVIVVIACSLLLFAVAPFIMWAIFEYIDAVLNYLSRTF
jgi:hypothetical protein